MANLISQAKVLAKLTAEANRKQKVEEANTLPQTLEELRALTGYTPRPSQTAIFNNLRRFSVAVCHRRFGKTVLNTNYLIERAFFCPFPDGEYAYAAPTYGQAERISWKYFEAFTRRLPGVKLHRSALSLSIPTLVGSRAMIRLYGLDNPKQNVRGAYQDGVVFDETPHIPRDQWTQVVRPMLSDGTRRGIDALGRPNQWASFIGTPMGPDWFYDLYRSAEIWQSGGYVEVDDNGRKSRLYSEEWAAFVFRASETGIIPAEELEAIRREMDPDEYGREFECSFTASVRGSIYGYLITEAEKAGRIVDFEIEPTLPVSTAWDLGWDDATAIWFFQQVGEHVIKLVGYREWTRTDLQTIARDLAEFSDNGRRFSYGYHLGPHDMNTTEVGVGKSRKRILEQAGVKGMIVVPQTKQPDQEAAAKKLIRDCVFAKSACAQGIDCLRMVRRSYDVKRGVLSMKFVHDRWSHGASAFQTLAVGIKKIHTMGVNPNHSIHGEF